MLIFEKTSENLDSLSLRAAVDSELDSAKMSSAGMEWVDPEDPTVIAENELLGAAAAIEAAAKKLEQLRPRTKPKVRGR